MKKCKCGFKTWSSRRYRKHKKECEVLKSGQSETWPAEGQEVKEELVKTQVSEEPVEAEIEEIADKGIDFEEMTVNELRDLARAEGLPIYGSKAALIERLKEGE